MVKTTSALGISVKKRLSDITNLTSYRVSPTKSEIFQELDSPTKMYIDQLLKENLFLMKQVQEKNELVELSGMELRNLRLGLQMIQLQNWQLAQTNTRMLAELNLSKEKMRALQHEIACKDVLLKAKSLELQLPEKAGEFGCDEEADNTLQPNDDSKKYPDRKRTTRRHCNITAADSNVSQTAKGKENAKNKRRISRRRSSTTKLKPNDIPEHDLFEIDVANFPLCRNKQPMDDPKAEASSCLLDSSSERNTDHSSIERAASRRRSSAGRPVCKAA
ncbi:hypothetical protein Droror1_Dr00002903 [Drosera rotundifolia]